MRIILRNTIYFLLWFAVFRVCFFVYNVSLFEIDFMDLSRIFLLGLAFDFSTALYYLFPFYLISVLALFFKQQIWNSLAALFAFLSVVFCGLVSAFDMIYFAHANRRISVNIFIGIKDAFGTYTSYALDFWWLVIFLALFIVINVWLLLPFSLVRKSKASIWQKLCVLPVFLLVYYFGIFGFGNRPLSPSTALMYESPRNAVLITNTPQALLYSLYKGYQSAEIPSYFSQNELDKNYSIVRRTPEGEMKKDNILIFILESFSRDVLDKNSNYKAKTPFLDTLMAKSLVFENAFANGSISTYGLVSILGGIPPLIDLPYYHSQYKNNDLNAVGTLLSHEGYDTNFFLGTVSNSFGFNECTSIFGMENFYSQSDFPNYKEHLSPWGVFDEPYFEFVQKTLDAKPEPFFATVFNVSSHSPFVLPVNAEHSSYYDEDQEKELNAISYVDHSLKLFFENAKDSDWYNNTLFVFVADHWGSPSVKKKRTALNVFEIPLFFYHPSDDNLQGVSEHLAQQLDVVPTILDYLNYDKKYMSFGVSLFENKEERYIFSKHRYIDQIANDCFVLGYDREAEKSSYLYQYNDEPKMSNNLVDSPFYREEMILLEDAIKARIQRYFYSMENNRLEEE